MDIKYIEKLNAEQIKFLSNEFAEYSNQFGIESIYKEFNFIAENEDEIIGLISGNTLYDEVSINELIVSKKHRREGIGTQLIKQVENYFRNAGFKYISVPTHEFLAPKFYEKLGFYLEYVRENKENPRLTKYFFVKYF